MNLKIDDLTLEYTDKAIRVAIEEEPENIHQALCKLSKKIGVSYAILASRWYQHLSQNKEDVVYKLQSDVKTIINRKVIANKRGNKLSESNYTAETISILENYSVKEASKKLNTTPAVIYNMRCKLNKKRGNVILNKEKISTLQSNNNLIIYIINGTTFSFTTPPKNISIEENIINIQSF